MYVCRPLRRFNVTIINSSNVIFDHNALLIIVTLKRVQRAEAINAQTLSSLSHPTQPSHFPKRKRTLRPATRAGKHAAAQAPEPFSSHGCGWRRLPRPRYVSRRLPPERRCGWPCPTFNIGQPSAFGIFQSGCPHIQGCVAAQVFTHTRSRCWGGCSLCGAPPFLWQRLLSRRHRLSRLDAGILGSGNHPRPRPRVAGCSHPLFPFCKGCSYRANPCWSRHFSSSGLLAHLHLDRPF